MGLVERIENEIRRKKRVCLGYLQLKYVPEHGLEEDYYLEFKGKIFLGGFTEDTVEAFREIHRKYGFMLLLSMDEQDRFWLVPGRPNCLVVRSSPASCTC